MSLFCEQCGAQLKETATFCHKCGARVNRPMEEPEPTIAIRPQEMEEEPEPTIVIRPRETAAQSQPEVVSPAEPELIQPVRQVQAEPVSPVQPEAVSPVEPEPVSPVQTEAVSPVQPQPEPAAQPQESAPRYVRQYFFIPLRIFALISLLCAVLIPMYTEGAGLFAISQGWTVLDTVDMLAENVASLLESGEAVWNFPFLLHMFAWIPGILVLFFSLLRLKTPSFIFSVLGIIWPGELMAVGMLEHGVWEFISVESGYVCIGYYISLGLFVLCAILSLCAKKPPKAPKPPKAQKPSKQQKAKGKKGKAAA